MPPVRGHLFPVVVHATCPSSICRDLSYLPLALTNDGVHVLSPLVQWRRTATIVLPEAVNLDDLDSGASAAAGGWRRWGALRGGRRTAFLGVRPRRDGRGVGARLARWGDQQSGDQQSGGGCSTCKLGGGPAAAGEGRFETCCHARWEGGYNAISLMYYDFKPQG